MYAIWLLLNEKDTLYLEKIINIDKIYSTKNDYYLDAKWTKNDLLEIINQGGFSDTLLNLEISKRRPLR